MIIKNYKLRIDNDDEDTAIYFYEIVTFKYKDGVFSKVQKNIR